MPPAAQYFFTCTCTCTCTFTCVSVEQVAFADRMLLNKTDLVSEADLERVEKRLRSLNGFAPIMRTLNSEISVDR